eukprot:TRINITY_DN3917_c0_g2_i4.p1 TRINITY_DN3917_c0_g2~~TRINITY_DN3917_c0_g2_i4.p1  ORF type:complete len:128 (-),score=0.27 TRINITY_DN3917_c0_g2_i4:148-531(-)
MCIRDRFRSEYKNAQNEDAFQKNYTHSKQHRYIFEGSKNLKNLCRPSNFLHLANLPPHITTESVKEIIDLDQSVMNIEFLNSESTMAIVEVNTLSNAIEIIIARHNQKIENRFLKVSFSKKAKLNEQ